MPLNRHTLLRELCRNCGILALSVIVGLLLGKILSRMQANGKEHADYSDSVTVFGCGVEARIRISSDEDLELRDLMTKLGNLPARVNGAVIKSNNRSWYVRLNEMSDRNGIGKMPISPGDSIHFVHRNN